MKTNCPNCGAPIEGDRCPYCNTPFIDMGCIDIRERYRPIILKFKDGDRIYIVKARLTRGSVEVTPDYVYADGLCGPRTAYALKNNMRINLEFEGM